MMNDASQQSRAGQSFFDVRMRGFRDRTDVDEVLRILRGFVSPLPSLQVDLSQAANRVLAADIVAESCVPSFDRAAMDGYAVRGMETFGASPYNPLTLEIVGEALPGKPCAVGIDVGQAIRIMTGAPIPRGADAVLQAEFAEEDRAQVRFTEPVPPGKNIGKAGEDIQSGLTVLRVGRRLRPQDLGILASLGVGVVQVVRQPTVALYITGSELLATGSRPTGYAIVDSNSIMLRALVQRDGGIPAAPELLGDERENIRAALVRSSEDVILLTGGSSVGKEDHAPGLLAELGELLVHGVALRPASPTGVGRIAGRLVFLLPGNPASCLCGYDFFAGPAIRQLGGRSMDWPYRVQKARLARKIVSMVGRVDYVRVVLGEQGVEPLATSGASILSSTTRADGFVMVASDSEGLPAGQEVAVYLYDA